MHLYICLCGYAVHRSAMKDSNSSYPRCAAQCATVQPSSFIMFWGFWGGFSRSHTYTLAVSIFEFANADKFEASFARFARQNHHKLARGHPRQLHSGKLYTSAHTGIAVYSRAIAFTSFDNTARGSSIKISFTWSNLLYIAAFRIGCASPG